MPVRDNSPAACFLWVEVEGGRGRSDLARGAARSVNQLLAQRSDGSVHPDTGIPSPVGPKAVKMKRTALLLGTQCSRLDPEGFGH